MVSEALRESRVVPYVQAIVDNFTGEVAKLECLARIKGKDGKILQPYQFIDHAKHSNLLPILTREMFKKACAELKETGLDFSINISWQDLADPELVTEIQKICEQHGIDPSRVTVEILEEALASNAKEFEGKMAGLKSLGCKIALDDFGAEGSNFSRFNRVWWPNVIKIDGQFIKGVDTDSDKRLILEAIVAAANKLGCELVAEFVDNEKVWRIVRDLGIRYTQGYFFHKPEAIPSEGFAKISADIRAIYDAVTTPEAETKSKVEALLSVNGKA